MLRLAIVGLLLAGPAAAQDLAAVSQACGAAALKRGLFVQEVVAFEEVERGGRVAAVQATMTFRATRRRIVCVYDMANGKVSLEEVGRAQIVPPEAETGQACERAAKAKGYKLRERLSQEDLLDARGTPGARLVRLSVKKEGAKLRLDCTYTFATKAITLAVQPE